MLLSCSEPKISEIRGDLDILYFFFGGDQILGVPTLSKKYLGGPNFRGTNAYFLIGGTKMFGGT